MWSKLYIIVAAIILVACKTQQDVVKLERTNASQLTECVDKSRISPEWFSAKISTDLRSKGEKNSFKINLRIRKDSLIWVNISKGPIIVATTLITPDSIKAVVKVGDEFYFEKDFDYIKRLYELDIDYKMLQDLLLGNPVGFSTDEKYKELKDSVNYVISTHSQRQIDRAYDKLPRKEEKQYIQRYWVRPLDCKVVRTLINQLKDSSNINIDYLDFKEEDTWIVPNKVVMNADTPRDSVLLELNYSRYKLNKPLKFTYKVNSKFPKIDPENRQPGDLEKNQDPEK